MTELLRIFPATWRALLVPRRAVAIAAVGVPLIAAQAFFGGTFVEISLASLLVAAFVLVGPASWRALFPTTRPPPPLPAVVRLFAFLAVAVGCVGSIGILLAELLGIEESFLTASVSLVICAAFFVVGSFGLGRDIEMEASLERERSRVALLQREAEHARLMALSNHLDPHFIFNTLNAIAEWCRDDGEVAERAILQLSQILRAVLQGVRQTAWPLARERELLDALAALHLLRDPGLFSLEVRAAQGADDVLVPPLLLLPLIENAVKHGPAAGHRGVLALSFEMDARGLVVTVENPGPYKGQREGGEGVRMVESRLALYTDGRGGLRLFEVAGPDGGPRTRAELVLPPATAPASRAA